MGSIDKGPIRVCARRSTFYTYVMVFDESDGVHECFRLPHLNRRQSEASGVHVDWDAMPFEVRDYFRRYLDGE